MLGLNDTNKRIREGLGGWWCQANDNTCRIPYQNEFRNCWWNI